MLLCFLEEILHCVCAQWGVSAIFGAIMFEHVDAVQFLIDSGASVRIVAKVCYSSSTVV